MFCGHSYICQCSIPLGNLLQKIKTTGHTDHKLSFLFWVYLEREFQAVLRETRSICDNVQSTCVRSWLENISAISGSRKERQRKQHIVKPKYLQSFILQYDSVVTQFLYYPVLTANITMLFSVGQCMSRTEKVGSSDKASELYPRGDWLEFRQGNWLLWLKFFVFS
jgi:hypothetical protein